MIYYTNTSISGVLTVLFCPFVPWVTNSYSINKHGVLLDLMEIVGTLKQQRQSYFGFTTPFS